MAFTITHEETGRISRFRDEDAYEAALAWYNDSSKRALLDFYENHDDAPLGEIYADENCTKLADDWADVVMEMYARVTFGRP